MNLKNKIEVILNKRKKLNINDDDGIQKSWDEIIEVLSEHEEHTIRYLENCNKEDLYWISEVFEDIAENLQSQQLIICLKKLDQKYPDLEMTTDINIAESYIERNREGTSEEAGLMKLFHSFTGLRRKRAKGK